MMINPFSNKKVRNTAIISVAVIAALGVAYSLRPKKKTNKPAKK